MKTKHFLILSLFLITLSCLAQVKYASDLHQCLTKDQGQCLEALRTGFLDIALKYNAKDTTSGIMSFLQDPNRVKLSQNNETIGQCLKTSGLTQLLWEPIPSSPFSRLVSNTKICDCAYTHEIVRQWCERIETVGDLSPGVCAQGARMHFTCEEYLIVEVQEILALTFILTRYH